MEEKFIRCIIFDEPLAKNDSGWGSRLTSWSFAYYLSSLTNFKYTILIDGNDWPETIFVSLPNTKIVYGLDEGSNIVDQTLFDKIQNYKADIDYFCSVDDWTIKTWFDYDMYFDPDPISLVTFKEEALNDFFRQKEFNDCVGVHIRRGPGVWTTKEDFESIPEQFRSYYKDINLQRKLWRGNNKGNKTFYRQRFIKDMDYFKTFDKILKINPKQKFYISTDIPVEALDYYKDKYKIMTKENYFESFIELSNISNDNTYILEYLFDFFIFANTKFLLLSEGSSWSECAQRLNGKASYTIPNSIFYVKKIQKILTMDEE